MPWAVALLDVCRQPDESRETLTIRDGRMVGITTVTPGALVWPYPGWSWRWNELPLRAMRMARMALGVFRMPAEQWGDAESQFFLWMRNAATEDNG